MAQALSTPPAEAHIAACGLFCTNCRSFKLKKCQGCQIGPKFERCSVRKCCVEKGITTCAQCEEFSAPRDYRECKRINNIIPKVFGLIFGTNRPKALALLRDHGQEAYLAEKRASGKM